LLLIPVLLYAALSEEAATAIVVDASTRLLPPGPPGED